MIGASFEHVHLVVLQNHLSLNDLYTNLRSEWYNKRNDERGEEDLFWERESHEPQLIIQSKKSNVA